MSKYFEITYEPPFKGLHVQAPETAIEPGYSPATQNFFFRNNELRSRPVFTTSGVPPAPNGTVAFIASFFDATAMMHTVALTSTALYQLTPLNAWVSLLGGVTGSGPTPFQTFANRIVWSSLLSTAPNIYYWDGIATSPGTAQTTITGGPNNFGAAFLTETNNSILAAYTSEQATPGGAITTFSNRIRWSGNGLNLNAVGLFDPAVNLSAGSNDFLDVPDAITGLLSIGSSVTYIFRTNGITEQSVNSSGVLPFTWNHLWGQQMGIGNVFPGLISSYGSIGMFVDYENVYQVSLYSFEPVGGTARDAIIADLQNATGTPYGGFADQVVAGYVWLTYHICIPLAGGMKEWVYDLEQKSWQPFFVSTFTPTANPSTIWID